MEPSTGKGCYAGVYVQQGMVKVQSRYLIITITITITSIRWLMQHWIYTVYAFFFNFCEIKLLRIADFSNFRIFIFADAGP